jgi:hypothetical protein
MDVPAWVPAVGVTLALTAIGLAATWGGVRSRLVAVEKLAAKSADDLAKSRGDQGTRIGKVEKKMVRVEVLLSIRHPPRRRTLALGVPTEVPDEVHDEDSGGETDE